MILDIKRDVERNPNRFDADMARRGSDVRAEDVLSIYKKYIATKLEVENARAELNVLSKNFDPSKRDLCKNLSNNIQNMAKDFNEIEARLTEIKYSIPNLLDPRVPTGESDKDNVVLETCGEPEHFANPRHHEDIGIQMGYMHRDEAVNMSGSRFIILSGELARLERAIAQFAMNFLLKRGFTEMSIPYMVRQDAMRGTGQLSKFTSDEFFAIDDKCLIPTGEVPLISYFANKTIEKSVKVATISPCFRKEAGSLGRDTKGLIRLHQFTKVEMVAITSPDESEVMHQELLKNVCDILVLLKLPHRIMEICSGDIGFTALRQFDVEVWMPGQGKYVEVASCSNCGDYQAQRIGLKYGKAHAHTLNSTAVACGRVVAAILENHCQDGVLRFPEVFSQA